MDDLKLLLRFDTDDSQFIRGFEAGRLWEQFKDPEAFDQEIHAANAEMVLRMAEAAERRVTAEELGDGWMRVTVEEAE